MGIFNFRKKQKPESVSSCNLDKQEDEFGYSDFADKHIDALTKCLNDARVCKLLGVDNIFTASDIRVPDLPKEDQLYIMSHMLTLYRVISNAKKSYISKFDTEVYSILRKYRVSEYKDEAVKQKIQAFYSLKELIAHFEAALATTERMTDVVTDDYNKDAGQQMISELLSLLQRHFDVEIRIMLLTDAYSGFSFVE